MEKPGPRAPDLTENWQRHDWRESFFAPGFVILQALTRDGRTASGAGRNRDEAFDRCIGETAEIVALAAFRAGGGAFEPWRDGLAAHPHPGPARDAAMDEACERRAVADWWLGRRPAVPVAAEWVRQAGLAAQLDRARDGAALRRRTDWWQIGAAGDPRIMICRSMSPEGQDPVLGYGAHRDPVRAAGKALRELLLMELNLMELLAARSFGREGALQAVRNRIRGYARRAALLFPEAVAIHPAPPGDADAGGCFDTPPACHEISPPEGPLSVWICRPDAAAPPFTDETGLPYL
ncbi:YcaO-like family protein [Paracoccus denitrificans]|uniref:YcaO-like family protein n=1 Tax=Paracoccus denitrificans TaxID=266 RepID=UPI001E5E0925|nr:YcaO-like family protein [Paracoccus denitrificans]UFS66668.1 YcaO-like family protein [Paracoccus denitrificans]